MKSSFILIFVALAIGVAIGVYLADDAESPSLTTEQNSAAKSIAPAIVDTGAINTAELNHLLQDEIKARKALQHRVDLLSQQFATLKENPQDQFDELGGQTDITDATKAEDDWFNEQALVDSGMSSSQARELKEFFEQQELQQLYLRDQANREGWDRQKYRDEIQALNDQEDALKDRLGETAYDAYLYASGQSNRVAVSSVLATAPAGAVGIQAGDHILRYDNQRIYSGFELRQATMGGNAGDSVPVEVERDGETLEFYVVRGPLGIRMNSVSVAP